MRERMSLRMMEIGDEDESGEMEADGILESGELIVCWTGIYDIILSVKWIEIDEQLSIRRANRPRSSNYQQ